MTIPLPDPEFAPLLSLGLGGPILGIARWLDRPQLAGLALVGLGSWGAAAFAAGQPTEAWLPPAGLTAVYLLAVIAIRLRPFISRALVSRSGLAGAFVLLGPLLACAWVIEFDRSTQSEEFVPHEMPPKVDEPPPVLTNNTAHTDRDRIIPLYTRGPADENNLLRSEKYHANNYSLALIRTAAIEQDYNCHGWIFTGGRYWVRGEFVDSILNDNGYQRVDQPRQGDLVVYRAAEGNVLHSGLVRVADDSLILIESKWGTIGRYVHPPSEQPYSNCWTYYRSSRQGHLLNIGESSPTVPAIAE
jgi:hypothetical protein